MTTLYLDTEFNGFGGELISMALVSPEGDEWYKCVKITEPYEKWVRQNVVPKLGKEPISGNEFRRSFHKYLMQFGNPEVVCDWYEDAVHFFSMFEGVGYDSSLHLPCTLRLLKTPPGEPKPDNPHNALSDARALMVWHQRAEKKPKRKSAKERERA